MLTSWLCQIVKSQDMSRYVKIQVVKTEIEDFKRIAGMREYLLTTAAPPEMTMVPLSTASHFVDPDTFAT